GGQQLGLGGTITSRHPASFLDGRVRSRHSTCRGRRRASSSLGRRCTTRRRRPPTSFSTATRATTMTRSRPTPRHKVARRPPGYDRPGRPERWVAPVVLGAIDTLYVTIVS